MKEKSSKSPVVPSLKLDSILHHAQDPSKTVVVLDHHHHQEPEEGEDRASLEVEPSWKQQPVLLPTYTPSEADKEEFNNQSAGRDSPPTTPVDDPIHVLGSRKHFGFSSRQSRASFIFPWQKHKPAVCHQYAPHRPPLSKRSSLAGLKVLPVMRPDPVLHLEEEELDLLHLDASQLAQRTLELLHLMNIQDWKKVQDHRSLDLFRISGALTNCIFLVTGPSLVEGAKPRKVLLRVYGVGLESLISRNDELLWLRNLSTMDIGPSLLGIFKNGRFEEYVESTTLTKDDIRHPRTSRHIAHRMCELHNIVNVFPPPEGCVPQTQHNIARWIPLAQKAIEQICAKDPVKRGIMDKFDFGKFLVEIEEVSRELTVVRSPLVFAHNDTQYGNILRTTDESGELVVIDFEYAGYNTRGFDIGNHFCEWTADYHSERPSLMYPDRYPTKDEQLNFLEAYMEAEIAMCGYHLTAINLSKYTKKRRSFRSTIAIGLTKATLSALQATSAVLKRRASSGEIQKENHKKVSGGGDVTMESSTAVGDGSVHATGSTTIVTTDAAGRSVSPSPPPSQTSTSDGRKGNSAAENEHRLQIRSGQRHEKGGGDGSGGVSKAEILDSMYKEVNKFALTSHIMWGLWGLIQASQSEIDFDYFEYSMQRLNEFRRRREEFMLM